MDKRKKNPRSRSRPKPTDWQNILSMFFEAGLSGDTESLLRTAGAFLKMQVDNKTISKEAALGWLAGLRTAAPMIMDALKSLIAPRTSPPPTQPRGCFVPPPGGAESQALILAITELGKANGRMADALRDQAELHFRLNMPTEPASKPEA